MRENCPPSFIVVRSMITTTLIHDFRPALDGDGIACLRDEVSKTFYRNSGTGSFVAGPQLEPEPGEGKDPYTWYEDDIPTADLMEKYLANVSALRSTIDLLSTTARGTGEHGTVDVYRGQQH